MLFIWAVCLRICLFELFACLLGLGVFFFLNGTYSAVVLPGTHEAGFESGNRAR